MRLINARTLTLESFVGGQIPKYAILSHRWEDEEYEYSDLKDHQATDKKGFKKIQAACIEALKSGFSYIWVDTCCIDKSSSAELSEAINSMYQWYRSANVCFAYLSDVVGPFSSRDQAEQKFTASLWFSRGWTLQELIAPRILVFYTGNWEPIGTKNSHELSEIIKRITGIDEYVLLDADRLNECSIAKRMSWAAGRTTTRTEDTAYSLLGIFDVNMPMLYGEGHKAFLRLQEEIIKRSSDHSIFLWSRPADSHQLLAPNPACFAGHGNIKVRDARYAWRPSLTEGSKHSMRSYSITNFGLDIELPLIPWCMNTYLAKLNCEDKDGDGYGLLLTKTYDADQYICTPLSGEFDLDIPKWCFDGPSEVEIKPRNADQLLRIYIAMQASVSPRLTSYFYGFRLRHIGFSSTSTSVTTIDAREVDLWDSSTGRLSMREGMIGAAGMITVKNVKGKDIFAWLGFDFNFDPVILITQVDPEELLDSSTGSEDEGVKITVKIDEGSHDGSMSMMNGYCTFSQQQHGSHSTYYEYEVAIPEWNLRLSVTDIMIESNQHMWTIDFGLLDCGCLERGRRTSNWARKGHCNQSLKWKELNNGRLLARRGWYDIVCTANFNFGPGHNCLEGKPAKYYRFDPNFQVPHQHM